MPFRGISRRPEAEGDQEREAEDDGSEGHAYDERHGLNAANVRRNETCNDSATR